MTKQHFITLFKYEAWANVKIAEALKQQMAVPKKCTVLFNHIGAALDVWYSRVTNESRVFDDLFSDNSINHTDKLVHEASEKWIKYLSQDDVKLENNIKYSNLKGIPYENTILDIITQLVTHGPYHRGQINQLLKQNGLEAVSLDYILFVRK
jgi:uncharacterized damage-inducible protein DinB